VLSVLVVVAIISIFSSAEEPAGKRQRTSVKQITETHNRFIFYSFHPIVIS
jgi:hypothetical protein